MKLLHLFGIVAVLLALGWFANQLVQSAAAFPSFGVRQLAAIALCAFVYTVPAVVSGLAWYHLMRVVGESQARPVQATSINCLAQAGKYLPGNVAHYVGRVVLARQAGWGTTNTLFTIFIETLWSVAMAASMALLAVIYAGDELFTGLEKVPKWYVLAVSTAGAIFAPLLGHRVFEVAAQLWARRQGISISSLQVPPMRSFWLVICVYLFNYLIMGWVLILIVAQVFGETPGPIFLFAGIFAVAWVTGFVTPGAPAGLGIREVILVAAFTPLYGADIAVGIAAALRVVTIAGDGLVFVIGLGLKQLIHQPAVPGKY